jgi:imidazolonepropionase-like amidohydrolase/ABC-type multidrug transport system permease subunit
MGRDRSVLFFSYLFPLTFFFLFAQVFDARQSPAAVAQVIAMVLLIGILGQGFFGAGMRTVLDRETNVLRRFKVAPINAAPLIVASLVSGLVSFVPTVVFFLVLGRIVYGAPLPQHLGSLFVFLCVGIVAFRAMGMIVASVVNSQQEAQILIQVLYLPMLFLSGATFPVSVMPIWVRMVAQFLPSTYLFQGMQAIMLGGQTVWANLFAMFALLLTLALAVFVGVKLFRWEKEEKIAGKAKLWIVAVLAPFFIMGAWQAHTRQNIEQAKILTRNLVRARSVLFQHARVFTGKGTMIPDGAVLVRNGKIAHLFLTAPKDTKPFNAEVVDAAGKTLMPGLIDMHVHIGAPGGVYRDPSRYGDPTLAKRRLAAYLYSGVTAVRSTGDWLDQALTLKKEVNSGRYLGAEFFTCGPIFTAPGGHPTELLKMLPERIRQTGEEQFVRLPKSAGQAREQVQALKTAGVDCIKSVLDAGNSRWQLFNRLDTQLYDAVVSEAHHVNLPSATHTGSAADVKDAVGAGTDTVEHGSMSDAIPRSLFDEMKAKGIGYDPTLSVFEGLIAAETGDTSSLDSSLVQQVGPADMLDATRAMVKSNKRRDPTRFAHLREAIYTNLSNAYKCGVPLIAGSDAGNMLVVHGPTVQRELELWVQHGIPPVVALQAATYNAAKYLRAEDRIGSVEVGRDANLILVDGDPTQDIHALEHINYVMFRGEQIERTELFKQD